MNKSITKQVIGISVPNSISQILRMAPIFISTIIAAQLGTQSLAAMALAYTLYLNIVLFVTGINYGFGILVGKYVGANDPQQVSVLLKQSFWIALLLAIPITALLPVVQPFLLFLGQNPYTVALTQSYLNGLSYGIWALFIAIALQQFLLGIGHPKILNLFSTTGLIFCVISFYILVFGHFGFKPMGIRGIGVGMSISMILNLTLMLIYILSKSSIRKYLHSEHTWLLNLTTIKAIFKIGLPISINILTEIVALSILVIIIGHINHMALAAYQIVSQLMFIPLMFPFAINQACAIITSQCIGRKEGHYIKHITKVSNIIAIIPVATCSLLFLLIPTSLIHIFLQHQHLQSHRLIPLTTHMLMITAVLQLIDCVRLIGVGTLRGMHDVTKPLLYSVIGFCIINSLLALLIGFILHLGVLVLWLSTGTGIITATILVYKRLHRQLAPYDLNPS